MLEQTQKPILKQTLGELLQTNPQARELIMRTMNVDPAQLQQMINSANDNPMMNQTIGELFKNGTMQKAASRQKQVQVSPDQMQQIMTTLFSDLQNQPQQEKPSFLQKLKNLFG